ncbi:MAG: ATP12 family protein [Caulobacterales bacterium]
MTGSAIEPTKKFYKAATVAPAANGPGYAVLLDGRSLRTPAKAVFNVPTQALARLVAEEWNAQGEHILPASMPATRMANVAIDRMSQTREGTIAEIVKYANSDLLLVRAEEPEELAAAERHAWDPILHWAEEALGAVFIPTAGIMIGGQDHKALDIIAAEADAFDNFKLTALAHLGALYGSSLLALAVLKGRISAEEGFEASRADEAWQEAKWGVDYEAADRTARLKGEVHAVARFLSALDTVDTPSG